LVPEGDVEDRGATWDKEPPVSWEISALLFAAFKCTEEVVRR
jgi:hypothetical protein